MAQRPRSSPYAAREAAKTDAARTGDTPPKKAARTSEHAQSPSKAATHGLEAQQAVAAGDLETKSSSSSSKEGSWTPDGQRSPQQQAAKPKIRQRPQRKAQTFNEAAKVHQERMQQQAHQLQRENREFRLLGDNKTPTEALRGLSTLYGATVTHFDVQELVSDFGFNNDPLRTCIRILGAFEVVSRDEITNELVWNGMGRAFRGISGVVQDAVVSSSKATLVHLARRLTVVGFNEITTPGPFNPWCAHELLSKYINLLVAPLSESNLDEMIAFFVELGYVEIHLEATAKTKAYYRWSENFVHHIRQFAQRRSSRDAEELRIWIEKLCKSSSSLATAATPHGVRDAQTTATSADAGPSARSRHQLETTSRSKERARSQTQRQSQLQTQPSSGGFKGAASPLANSLSSSPSRNSSTGVQEEHALGSAPLSSRKTYKKYVIQNSQGSVVSSPSPSPTPSPSPAPASSLANSQASERVPKRVPRPRAFQPPRQVSKARKESAVAADAKSPSSSNSRAQLSYLQHPLPVPKTAQGHPANAALVTERVLSDKEPKALESEPPLPTPSQMLKYQISCVEEFMTRYCAYYSKVTGNPIKVLTPEDLAMGNESQDGANSSRQSEVLGTQRKSELSIDVKKDNGPSLLPGSQSKESPQHQAISANQLKENMSRNGSAREDDVVLENEAPAALSALPSPRAASSTRNEFPDAVFSQDSMGSFSGTSQIFNISQEMLNISQFNLSQNSLSSLGPLGLSFNMENDGFPSSQVESSADRLGSFYEGLDKDIEQELTGTPEPARES